MNNTSKIHTCYNDDDFLPLKEAAEYIGMSQSFLKTIKYRNNIPFYKVGGSIKYKVGDLRRYLESCRVDVATKGVHDE